jgi:hypothetical protein
MICIFLIAADDLGGYPGRVGAEAEGKAKATVTRANGEAEAGNGGLLMELPKMNQ